jgi:radical SAM protein with 4Fe4S-binding SPASM domain
MITDKPCYTGVRCNLSEQIPLSTPFSITLTPSTACIFRCCYCPQSIVGKEFVKKNMSWEIFTKIIDQLQEFDKPLKAIHFQGMGEPLLNKDLPDMIAYAKEKKVADRLNLITNGALLNRQTTIALINAGIDTIKISMQGITARKYFETCGVQINMEKFIDNVRFLYEHRKNCELFVKVANISLGEGDADKFFDIFSPITDRANIEYIKPMYEGIDYEKNHVGKNSQTNMYNQNHSHFEVCSLGFFMMYIDSRGNVFPCCNYRDPAWWGNMNNTTLLEIWNGKARKDFLKMMIRKERNHQKVYSICNGCNMPDAVMRVEDDLDLLKKKDITRLLEKL